MEVNAVITPGGTVKRLNANIPCWVCSLKAWEALAPFVYDGLLVANFQIRPQPKMTAEQHNLHCDFLFCEGDVRCSQHAMLPLWEAFQQRLLYRGNRGFQNKKLSMFCVFLLTFLWCLICGWLQLCIMYMELVKSSWHPDFRDKSHFYL